MIERVAEKHRTGGRLFAGTVILDTRGFVRWDLGAIAASARADKGAWYRRILRASSAVPIYLPPVYFPVSQDGQTHHAMQMSQTSPCRVRQFTCNMRADTCRASARP